MNINLGFFLAIILDWNIREELFNICQVDSMSLKDASKIPLFGKYSRWRGHLTNASPDVVAFYYCPYHLGSLIIYYTNY